MNRRILLCWVLLLAHGYGCAGDEQGEPTEQNSGQTMQAEDGRAGTGGTGGTGGLGEVPGSDVPVAGSAGSGGGAGTGGVDGADSGTLAAGGAGAGGTAGGAGVAGSAADSISCDPRMLRCRRAEPACGEGSVPQIVDGCYGQCVAIDKCPCDSPQACPNPNEFTCVNSTGHCSYYL